MDKVKASFERLDRQFLLPSLYSGYFDANNRARTRISHNALVAFVNDLPE